MKDKSRVLGTHWWNPPYLIPLVEVVQTEATDLKVVERCIDLLNRAGKVAVHVKKDVPGFVANRMQHALHCKRILEVYVEGFLTPYRVQKIPQRGDEWMFVSQNMTWLPEIFSIGMGRCRDGYVTTAL